MLADLGVGVRDLEPDRLGGIEQPIDVPFELEDAAVVGADALEDAVAVEQAVIEDADRRVRGGAPRAADVDEAVGRARRPRREIVDWTGFRWHGEAIMPKTVVRQADQSVNGLFRALGVDAKALPRTRPLYRRIVTLLEGGIARGAVPAGQQLPPERDLAAAMRISRATVVSAYRELEARGLVRGYVGRGTFVSAQARRGERAVRVARQDRGGRAAGHRHDDVRDLVRAAADPNLISVAAGVPALDCFPTDAFQRAMNHVLATQADAAWRHGPTEGLPRFAPRWRTASAASRSTSWCSPARSRGSICWRAA